MIKKEHKFFEKILNNDLDILNKYLVEKEQDFRNGLIPNIKVDDYNNWKDRSPITNLGPKYNIFQFHNSAIYNLYSAVREMAIEACDYYEIDFKKEEYMIQGWYNFDQHQKPDNLPDSMLHDHLHGAGAPDFHGYYCVAAEPSVTEYRINGFDGKHFRNINKNNRAILSETGHPHGIGNWAENFPRITIAYDVSPLRRIFGDTEQHWIPLA